MDYRRAKTIDLSNIGPQPGLNFSSSDDKPDPNVPKRSLSSDNGGVGDSTLSSSKKPARSQNRRTFVPKKGALKRHGAIRKKSYQLSPKIRQLREKARAEAKQKGIIGSPPETSFAEENEINEVSSEIQETDRPFSELRRHAFF